MNKMIFNEEFIADLTDELTKYITSSNLETNLGKTKKIISDTITKALLMHYDDSVKVCDSLAARDAEFMNCVNDVLISLDTEKYEDNDLVYIFEGSYYPGCNKTDSIKRFLTRMKNAFYGMIATRDLNKQGYYIVMDDCNIDIPNFLCTMYMTFLLGSYIYLEIDINKPMLGEDYKATFMYKLIEKLSQNNFFRYGEVLSDKVRERLIECTSEFYNIKHFILLEDPLEFGDISFIEEGSKFKYDYLMKYNITLHNPLMIIALLDYSNIEAMKADKTFEKFMTMYSLLLVTPLFCSTEDEKKHRMSLSLDSGPSFECESIYDACADWCTSKCSTSRAVLLCFSDNPKGTYGLRDQIKDYLEYDGVEFDLCDSVRVDLEFPLFDYTQLIG